MSTDKIIDKIISSFSDWIAGYYTNQSKVQQGLKNISAEIKNILELVDEGKPHRDKCDELVKKFTDFQGQIDFSLHPNKEEDKLRREKLLNALNSSKSYLQEIIVTSAGLKKILEELEQVIYETHPLHPLPRIAKKSSKVQLLLFGLPIAAGLSILSFYGYDQLYVVPGMKKECNETPGYRSNEWLARHFSPYRYHVEESHIISGNTCISLYNTSKVDNHLVVAEKIFSELQSINAKSIQATFFLEYIPKARNAIATEYDKSISLARDYVNDRNSKNYVLQKEDYDIFVKIGHVLQGKQDYDSARKLYELIIAQEGNDKHLNASLGICTTHIKLKNQKEPIDTILAKCKESVDKLMDKNLKTTENDNVSEKRAIAYYNYGCLLLRKKEYPEATKQFISGESKDGNNLNIKRAVFFSQLLNSNYDKAKTFIKDVIDKSGKDRGKYKYTDIDDADTNITDPNKVFYRDMQMGLGLAYLGLAEESDNEKEKLDHYKQAYTSIENSRDKVIGKIYLKKIDDCRKKIEKECSSMRPFKNNKEDDLLRSHLHNKFWAFINHYQMSKNIADAKVKIDVEDDKGLKGNACTILPK